MITLAPRHGFLIALLGFGAAGCGSRSFLELEDSGPTTKVTPDAGDAPIFPLALWREWTFEATVLPAPAFCAPVSTLSIVTESAGESPAFRLVASVPVPCFDVPGELEGAGDELRSPADSGVYLDTPIAEGHAWGTSTPTASTANWRRLGPITVAAGTFADCWSRDAVYTGGSESAVFCRGVGPVRFSKRAASGSYDIYVAELASKNF